MANKLIVAPAPHVQTAQSTTRIMRDGVIALMPALVVSTVDFGIDVQRVVALSEAACVAFEYLIQRFLVRGPLTVAIGAAAVTGVLLAFILPASIPWWIVVIGAFVAIAIGKMTFGGLGKNPFTPALVGRVFLLIAYPAQLPSFPPPAGAVADAGGEDDLCGVLECLGDLGAALLGALAADLRVGARALTMRQLFADLDFISGGRHVERLLICVHRDKVDAARTGANHAVDHVVAAAANADDLDLNYVFRTGLQSECHVGSSCNLLYGQGTCRCKRHNIRYLLS